MSCKKSIERALKRNLAWFRRSGIIDPADGRWGVAERVALTSDNEALLKMREHFPAWTDYDGYCIVEQRRADCNFETAYLFLRAYEWTGDRHDYDLAVGILEFLYCRSGLLAREPTPFIPGSWNWSHIKRDSVVYYDDEAWCVFLQLEIARRHPELDLRFQMRHYAMLLAGELETALDRAFRGDTRDYENFRVDPAGKWLGRIDLPHWGALGCMGLARAYWEKRTPRFADFVHRYFRFVRECCNSCNASEQAYALIGACAAATYLGSREFQDLAGDLAEALVRRMDPVTGNIPAEHYEAPVGSDLVDMIYTVNWALLGLSAVLQFHPRFRNAYERLLKLVLSIQDRSEKPQFHGCWRGMFDLAAGSWGGGNRFEGGAASIYSGWTNAPVSWVLLAELTGSAVFSPGEIALNNEQTFVSRCDEKKEDHCEEVVAVSALRSVADGTGRRRGPTGDFRGKGAGLGGRPAGRTEI